MRTRIRGIRSRHQVIAAGVVSCAVIGLAVALTPTGAAAGDPDSGPVTQRRDHLTAAARTPVDRRRNIVFVLTDDLSYDLVKYMPHVRALQKAGTTFANYTVTDSLCCPSRSSIFAGRYPHNTGVYTNNAPDGGFTVFHNRGGEKSTYATDLHDAGYRTAMMGKYLNGYRPDVALDGQRNYVPPGWDEWAVAGNGYSQYDYTLNRNGTLERHGHRPADYLNSVLAAKANSFVTRSARAKKPFALEVSSFSPHAPYTPSPRDVGTFPGVTAPRGPAFDRLPSNAPAWLAVRGPLTGAQQARLDASYRKRVQSVQSVDRLLAGLQRTLQREGVAKNTVVVFTSDNGYHLGQHRLMPGKQTAFDTDIHVPLIAAGAGVARNRVVHRPAENIDLRPTFDQIAETPIPAQVDGRSLEPLLAGRSTGPWRTMALIEHHGPDFDPSDPDRQKRSQGQPTTYDAIRTLRYTYVEYASGEREYYNRRADPYELHNAVGRLSPRTLTALHRRIEKLTACRGSVCREADRI